MVDSQAMLAAATDDATRLRERAQLQDVTIQSMNRQIRHLLRTLADIDSVSRELVEALDSEVGGDDLSLYRDYLCHVRLLVSSALR